jgi:hypothetical protein
MNRINNLCFLIVIIAALFWSCENERFPTEPEQNQENKSLQKSAVTAELFLYVYDGDPAAEVKVHILTENWTESAVTWNYRDKFSGTPWTNPGGTYATGDSNVISFSPELNNQYLQGIDITSIVKSWLENTENNGIILEQSNNGGFVTYSSSIGEYNPYILLTYSDGSQDSLAAIVDAYIWENQPFFTGNDDLLYSGLFGYMETRSLIKFDLSQIELKESSGCTKTKGYWKTHSKYGPSSYDSTWKGMEDTPFFLSNKTYFEVMQTPPKGGNIYYILAHQYIAAELNKLSGVDFSDASAAFNSATELFNEYSPQYAAGLKGKNGKHKISEWLKLKDILEDYNQGEIGPGSCE